MRRACFHYFAYVKHAVLLGRTVLSFAYCPDCKHCWDPKRDTGIKI